MREESQIEDPSARLEESEAVDVIARKPMTPVRLVVMLAVAGVAIWVMLAAVDTQKVLEAWRTADIGLVVAGFALSQLAIVVLNGIGLFLALRPAGYRGTLGRLFLVYAALEIAAAVQARIRTAAIAAWLKRRHGMWLRHSAGMAVLLMTSEALAYGGLSMLALWTFDSPEITAFGAVVVLSGLLFWGHLHHWFDGILRGPLRVLRRIQGWEIFRPLGNCRASELAQLLVVRLSAFVAIGIGHAVALRGFGTEVPIGALVIAIPLSIFVGGLPVSVGGLGTTQAVMLALLAPFGVSADVLLAYGLSYSAVTLPTQALTGLVVLRPGLDEALSRAAHPIDEPPGSAAEPTPPPSE